MLGSFIKSQNLYVNLDWWEKGDVGGWNGWHVFSSFYCDSSGETPSWSSSPLVHSSIWLCDKYSINSWNISSALHALISNRTQACCCIYAGQTTVMAVIAEIREITLTILCWSKNSFHSSPSSPNKEFMKGPHSSGHKYSFITGTWRKHFSSMLNIHQKAAEGCLTVFKKACWSQTRLNPRVRIWGSAGVCVLMLKWAVKLLKLSLSGVMLTNVSLVKFCWGTF